jgi:hypothetical protein
MQKVRHSGWVVIERYSDNNKFIRIPRSRTFKNKQDANKERKSMTPRHGGELFSIRLSALEWYYTDFTLLGDETKGVSTVDRSER